MPANRFYCPVHLEPGTIVILEGTEHHHLAHVMRMKVSDVVQIVNGQGVIGIGSIVAIDKKRTEIRIDSSKIFPTKLPSFFLGVPFMRLAKLEWVIEKTTELGTSGWILYPADRSEKTEFSSNQIERLGAIAIAALKQSGRADLPSIEILPRLSSLFAKEGTFLFGDPLAKEPLPPSFAQTPTPSIVITGPEGGFSSEEYEMLQDHAKGIRLSPHILRAETAPIAAASLLGQMQCRKFLSE